MRYNFEMLGDQRFQQLSAALITHEFPFAQALPTGQPDGGRDAFIRNFDGDPEVVFQVKYSKDPLNKDEREAILSLVKSELEKIERLKERGLKQYYFITNVLGSSHLDSGSIDRLNEELSKLIGVESSCWWRSDLDARIDNNWNVKWSYPEITSGPDVIQLLLNGTLGDRSRARNSALKAYLAKQYEDESDLKFKQVDLESNIFGLFTDLYVTIKSEGDAPLSDDDVDRINRNASATYNSEMHSLGLRKKGVIQEKVKASNLFTSPALTELVSQVVLEGGPGQGKSTITQYISQVNRARLLDRLSEISDLPEEHRLCPVRIPFRIDLRDYANWISTESKAAEAGNRHPLYSLEMFLAQQVRLQSGGFSFSVEDLSDVLAIGSSILFLDGFDEVADVELRRTIIQEATGASNRIRGLGYFCQIVVTSRPTAFVNAPSFSDPRWRHVELDAVEKAQIGEYLSRWVRAKSLSTTDAEQFGTQVMLRMDESHIAELARNPMQLAILLSLMWAHGESLPDKRTALYRSYVELFLNREAEKDRIIKDYRELILELHGYIAWILQAKVESKRSDGRISEADMLSAIEEYVDKEEYGSEIVDHLFRAMRQRVVAIVSRVVGTYEFEVQPLREFFAGQFLYDTAAYSPPGSEAKGTLPDRFAAIVRNPYWSNVTRFYAGCYSKGELANLAEGLEDFLEDKDAQLLRTPSAMTLTLISDWVFSQSVPSMKRLLTQVSDTERLRLLVSSVFSRNAKAISLPDRCGRKVLLEACFSALQQCTNGDERIAFAQLIRANSLPEERVEYWSKRKSNTKDLSGWINEGIALATFSEFEFTTTERKELLPSLSPQDASEFFSSMTADDLSDEEVYKFVRDVAFAGDDYLYFSDATRRCSRANILSAISTISQNDFIMALRTGGPNVPVFHYVNVFYDDPSDDGSVTVEEIMWASQLRVATRLTIGKWRTDPSIWSALLDDAISMWGPQFGFLKFALAGAMAISDDYDARALPQLDKVTSPLDWARTAKASPEDADWWTDALTSLCSDGTKAITCAACILWASDGVISKVSEILCRQLDSLPSVEFSRLVNMLSDLGRRESHETVTELDLRCTSAGARVAAVLLCAGRWGASEILLQQLIDYDGDDTGVQQVRMHQVFNGALAGNLSWSLALQVAKEAYQCCAIGIPFRWFLYRDEYSSFPVDAARKVLSAPGDYPIYLVNAAHSVMQDATAPTAVTEIAARDHWFEGSA